MLEGEKHKSSINPSVAQKEVKTKPTQLARAAYVHYFLFPCGKNVTVS